MIQTYDRLLVWGSDRVVGHTSKNKNRKANSLERVLDTLREDHYDH
jgi:hypothetical protein